MGYDKAYKDFKEGETVEWENPNAPNLALAVSYTHLTLPTKRIV